MVHTRVSFVMMLVTFFDDSSETDIETQLPSSSGVGTPWHQQPAKRKQRRRSASTEEADTQCPGTCTVLLSMRCQHPCALEPSKKISSLRTRTNPSNTPPLSLTSIHPKSPVFHFQCRPTKAYLEAKAFHLSAATDYTEEKHSDQPGETLDPPASRARGASYTRAD